MGKSNKLDDIAAAVVDLFINNERKFAKETIIRIVGEDPVVGLAVVACVLDRLENEHLRKQFRQMLMDEAISCNSDYT